MIYTKSNIKKTNPIKPNLARSNPIQSQFQKRPKMNVNKVSTRDYENIRLHRRAENKPNQTQFTGTQKTTRSLPVFYGSTISRMRFHPHKPAFPPKSPNFCGKAEFSKYFYSATRIQPILFNENYSVPESLSIDKNGH